MYEFKIEKMSCMSCVNHIEEELKEKDASVTVKPDLKGHILTVYSKLSVDEVKNTIEDAGYKVK